ncbi:MAG TPA: T9SS type A sorting domain-containing protein, partial [Bacteroidota bacterium]|nr:T9SS type A sorting domain-containing protein [Bacteroidota bacterium]
PNALVRTSGSVVVESVLVLNQDFDANNDTIFISNSAPDAVSGPGLLTRGAMQRMVRVDTAQAYRFESPSTYVVITGGPTNPFKITMSAYPDTLPGDFGAHWSAIGGVVDTLLNQATLDNVTDFSSYTPWTFGLDQGDSGLPAINRVYAIHSTADSGILARVSLRYDQGEVPAGTDESSLVLLRKKFSDRGPLRADWNIISLPVTVGDTRKENLFPSATSPAYAYDGTSSGYVISDSISNGKGYWIKFGTTQIADIPGEIRLDDTVEVAAGWNMIGVLSLPFAAQSVTSIPENIIRGKFFGYQGGYFTANDLSPSKGYWVNVAQSGFLVFHASADQSVAKQQAAPVENGIALERFNELIIRDAVGHEQKLYFGTDAAIDQLSYQLPPVPPPGSFDARYSTGTSLIVSNSKESKEFPILVSSESDLITVAWKINGPADGASLSAGKREIALNKNGSIQLPASGTPLVLKTKGLQSIPREFALEQNFPNPFNPNTVITYGLPVDAHVVLRVYDILGREVRTLIDENQQAGFKSVEWNSMNNDRLSIASGIYFYRIEATGVSLPRTTFIKVKKMLFLK